MYACTENEGKNKRVHFWSIQMDSNLAKDASLNNDVTNQNPSSTSGQQVISNTAAKEDTLEQFNIKLMQVIWFDK